MAPPSKARIDPGAPTGAQAEWPQSTAQGFRLAFDSGEHQTRAALACLCNHMQACGLDSEVMSTVELVVAEVINNITEHAYPGVNGPILLQVQFEPDSVVCMFTDSGAPFARGAPPDGKLIPPLALPEGGFGWHIIRALSTDLDYERSGSTNRLRLRIRV